MMLEQLKEGVLTTTEDVAALRGHREEVSS
jgi:hypothetical protein